MITSERTKELYLGSALHLQGKYDFIKYKGKINSELKPFEENMANAIRNVTISEYPTLFYFLVNISDTLNRDESCPQFIDLHPKKCLENYVEYKRFQEDIPFGVFSRVKSLECSPRKFLLPEDGSSPFLLDMTIENRIPFWFCASLINANPKLLEVWKDRFYNPIVNATTLDLLERSYRFFKVPSDLVKSSLKKGFQKNI